MINVAMDVVLLLLFLPCGLEASSEGPAMKLHKWLAVDLSMKAGNKSFLSLSNETSVGLDKPGFKRNRPRSPATEHHHQGDDSYGTNPRSYQCGKSFFVSSETDVNQYCPFDCPYFVQDKNDRLHCTFFCVKGEECTSYNPASPVADEISLVCRPPSVSRCREHSIDGTDTCKECQTFFTLGPDGLCYHTYAWAFYTLAAVLALTVIFVIYWLVDLALRFNDPESGWNDMGLLQGRHMRSRQKFHIKGEEGEKSRLYPLNTNLRQENVAGPGLSLFFNFQLMIIIWALLVALGWVALALIVDTDLFVLGTRDIGTPLENCVLVAWGHETQERLMPAKVLFLIWVYMISFVASLMHGVRQLRFYQTVDFQNKTMKDYAAFITGLPSLKGDAPVEETLKEALEKATDAPPGSIVGISICWNFGDQNNILMEALRDRIPSQEAGFRKSVVSSPRLDPPDMQPPRAWLWKLEKKLFEPAGDSDDEDPEDSSDNQEPFQRKDEDIKQILQNLETSEHAFVVFRTEKERGDIVDKVKQNGGFDFQQRRLHLEVIPQEPGTVQWHNFDNATTPTKVLRLCKGFGAIFLGIVLWTVLFYAPYACSVFSFNYANGQEPGVMYSMVFTMIVVVGNVIMYGFCAQVSVFVGFHFSDDREACYMVLYTISCTFNILLDVVTTYFIAWEINKGLDFRTYDGTKLQHLEDFGSRIETYAMQRALAENVFRYAWPSTFLVPFLLEPLVTILFPLVFGEMVVRSHPRIRDHAADDWLASPPMEMGRYADIILNVALAILIFFFPGGYTHKLFFFLFISHCYIYGLDHCRVLRTIPECTFATMRIDWWSQALLAPCCGLILSSIVLKANGRGYGYHLEGGSIVRVCILAFVTHVAVHLLLLLYLIPMFAKKEPETDPLGDYTYQKTNKVCGKSWFSANPVHCLRSELIYEHQPPCNYYWSGKEHTLKENEEIGCYFVSVDKSEVEIYEVKDSMSDVVKSMSVESRICCCG